MNVAVISGSNRPNSGSRKTADYVGGVLRNMGHTYDLFDMYELDLPLWSADMWNSESGQAQNWAIYRSRLEQCDGLVVVAVLEASDRSLQENGAPVAVDLAGIKQTPKLAVA